MMNMIWVANTFKKEIVRYGNTPANDLFWKQKAKDFRRTGNYLINLEVKKGIFRFFLF